MARRPIREYDAKRMLFQAMKEYGLPVPEYKGVLITSLDELDKIDQVGERLVVKPDEMFNKRQKLGLIALDVSPEEAKAFIRENWGREVHGGKIKHFLVEPYVPHEKEFYVAILSEREGDRIFYSEKGGIDIEENWDSVKEEFVPEGELSKLFPDLHRFVKEYDVSYLEINPYTIKDGRFVPLGVLMQLDDYAFFKGKWNLSFPEPFEKQSFPEEEEVEELDKRTGASLKLTILNPEGRIWLMTAGGGASVVFADSIYLQGGGKELANYAEYSGNPSTSETYNYAKAFFKAMFKHPNKPKALILGGGIANFTDVSKTFDGIIQAIKEYQELFHRDNVHVFVRRGGPNSDIALEKIKKELEALQIPVRVYSEEEAIDRVVKEALELF
ncbi:MAG: ATPase [Candidatus Micrarchaeota archaeon]|nr:ATPase [Candidatus Micrarchaeota archaeon]